MSVFRRRLMGIQKSASAAENLNYLTIETLEDGLTAKFSKAGLSYSIDGGAWVSLAASTNTPSINSGQTIAFKGELAEASGGSGTFTITKNCNIKGNCLSLIYGDNAEGQTSVKNKYAFQGLFKNCTKIQSVSEDLLPATALTENCYYQMFYGCSNLLNAPKLPAMTLSNYCYRGMFYNCEKLTTAPDLPATTLDAYCYCDMFEYCTGLITTPELPATTLETSCYLSMFKSCTGLTIATDLPAQKLAARCYEGMFFDCDNLKRPPHIAAENIAGECFKEMFAYCENLEGFNDVLHYTPLSYNCYEEMFKSCEINESITLPVMTLQSACYKNMFTSCTFGEGTKITLPAVSVDGAYDCYKSMFSNAYFGSECSIEVFLEDIYDNYGDSAVVDFLSNAYGACTVYCSSNYKGLSSDVELLKSTFREDFSVPSNFAIKLIGESENGNEGDVNSNVSVDVNGEWGRNDSISPSSSYAAFESVSNVGIDNSEATMYIHVNGLSKFTLYLRSNAESNYDYAMVSQLNTIIDGSTSTSSSGVKAHTKGKQNSGTSLSSYIEVVYDNIPSGDNLITVVYRKDVSQSSGTDKAYVLIPK